MPLDRHAHHDRRQGRRGRLEARPGHRQLLSALAGRQGPRRAHGDEGAAAVGSRISLFLRRHGGRRSLRRCQGARRQTWDNDVFELFFKPADDKPGYYEFQVNAAGTVMDMFLPRRGAAVISASRSDGDFHIDAKVQLRGTLNHWQDKDQGWSVEGRIPWRDFLRTGGRPAVGERWKFALCRYDYSVDFEGPELSTCAPLKSQPRPDFHHYEDYATLRFVGPPAKGAAKPHGIERRIAVDDLARRRLARPAAALSRPARLSEPQDQLPHRRRPPARQRSSARSSPRARPYAPTTISAHEGRSRRPATPRSCSNYDGVAYDIAFHPDFKKMAMSTSA